MGMWLCLFFFCKCRHSYRFPTSDLSWNIGVRNLVFELSIYNRRFFFLIPCDRHSNFPESFYSYFFCEAEFQTTYEETLYIHVQWHGRIPTFCQKDSHNFIYDNSYRTFYISSQRGERERDSDLWDIVLPKNFRHRFSSTISHLEETSTLLISSRFIDTQIFIPSF